MERILEDIREVAKAVRRAKLNAQRANWGRAFDAARDAKERLEELLVKLDEAYVGSRGDK